MKAAAKRLFSLLLCLVMLVGLFPAVSLAEGEGTAPAPAVEDRSEYQLKGTNTLGQVFANSLDLSGASADDATGSQVSELEIADGLVRVSYGADEEAELVLAFYEDPGEEEAPVLKLLATTTELVDPARNSLTLPLPEGLPEYYLVGAYLLRSGSHEPLCEEFTCSLYTKRYQDFIHAPLSDYEESGERLLVLEEGTEEDGTDASFAVFAEDVVLVKETAEANHLTANEDGSFTFTNPGETLLALQPGDKLAHTALDGSVTLILVQSRHLDADGSLTLKHDGSADAPVFFETVRIDTADDPNGEPTVDMSDATPGVEYLPEERVSGEVQRIIDEVKAGGDAPLYAGTEHAVVMDVSEDAAEITLGRQEFTFGLSGLTIGTDNINGMIFGKLGICPELAIRFYFSSDLSYVSIVMRTAISFHGGFEGTLAITPSLGLIEIPAGLPGLFVTLKPNVILEFQCSTTVALQFTGAVGLDYDSSRVKGLPVHIIYEFPHMADGASFQLEGTLRFGVRCHLSVDYAPFGAATKELCLISAGIVATKAIEFYGAPADASADGSEIHDCSHCIDGTIQLAEEFGYELSAGFGIISLSNEDALRNTIPLGTFFYSFDYSERGLGRCPHRRYRLTVTAVDGRDYSLAELAILDPEQLIRDSNRAHRVPWCLVSLQDKSGKALQSEDLVTDLNGQVSVYLPAGEYTLTGYTDELYGTVGLRIENAPRETALLLAAAETESGTAGALTWAFYPQSGLLAISGSGDMDDYAASGDGAAPWAAYKDRVKTVILRPGVKSVGSNAFRSFQKLSSVQLPTGCESIGSNAFRDLTRLESVTIPKAMEGIGQNAFSGCKALRRVVYDGSMTQWKDLKKNGIKSGNEPLLNAKLVLTSAVIDKGQCGENLFWTLNSAGMLTITGTGAMYDYAAAEIPWAEYADLVTGLTLEYGVTSLCGSAFAGLTGISELLIPETVTAIGAGAFSGCTGLARVELPEGLSAIPANCFRNCRGLSAINLPYSLRSIGQDAFAGCNMGSRKSKDVFYEGTKNDWDRLVSVGSGNKPLLDVLTTYSDDELASGSCGEHLNWLLTSEGLLILDGWGDMTSHPWQNITVNNVLYPVSKITAIRIPEGVTSLCEYAFSGLTGLTKAIVPHSVQSIGQRVFQGCWNMTSLTVPFIGASREDSRTLGYFFGNGDKSEYSYTIDGETVYRSSAPANLATVQVTDAREIAAGAFYHDLLTNKNNSAFISFKNILLNDGIEAIGRLAFYYQADLQSIILPANLKTIGPSCFYGCSSLGTISFPDGMTEIPDLMFYGCTGLKSYTIPPQVTRIGNCAFSGCSFSSFTVPDTVQEIGEKVFNECWGMTSLTVPFIGATREDSRTLGYFFGNGDKSEYSETIDGETIYRSKAPANLKRIQVTDAREIAAGAFHRDLLCNRNNSAFIYLTSIILNDSITSIGKMAFTYQTSLQSIILPANLKAIGPSCFYGCSSLGTISFPDGMTEIPDLMFYGCTGLKSYTIPPQVTRIGNCAFSGCSFSSFTVPDTVQEIGEKVFHDCRSMTSLTVPFIGASREDSRTLGYFFANGNRTESSQTFNGEKVYRSTVPAYLRTVRVTDAKELAPGAFHGSLLVSPNYDFVLLSRITLNDGIEAIGAEAFTDQSQLTDIDLPDSLTSIGAYCFSRCSSLRSISFPAAMTEIPDNMFSGCTGLTAYEIPSHVTRIGSYAFSGCSFTSFTIPDTVQEIGEKVFIDCQSMTSLTVPFIGASREDSRTLGYFFANGNRTESSQTFNGEKVYRSTVPAYLRTVRVTDAKELAPGAFHGSLLVSPNYDFVLLSRITLNDGIETIGAGAFTDQSQLTDIDLPDSLTSIGAFAFSGCSGLTKATFGGSMAEWLSVSIESGNTILSRIPIHCSDGVLLNGEEIEDPDAGEDVVSPEDPAESAERDDGESSGSISPVEPVIEPVPTDAPFPTEDPAPTEQPAPTEAPDPVIEPAPSEEPAPTEDPGYIGLASFSGESAPVDDTVYSASFAGLVPGEQYVLLITGEDVEDLDLRFASILFIAQEAAGEDGTLRFSYLRLLSETAPVIRLYGRSDKDLSSTEALGLVMHKGVSDPKAYSVHVSYEGTELKENEDYILSIEKRANGIVAVTVKGIRAYSGSRTVLAKETCLEAAETPDGYAIIHTAHTWGEWGESTATCEEPGERLRSCSVCGKKESESTEPIGHAWGEPSWTWSEDLASAEASFTCLHDSAHVTTLEASISPDGEDEYGVFHTATVVFAGKTYSDSRYLRLYLPGDLNRDREVDSGDLLRLRQILVGLESASAAADLNGDGTVDILDLVRFRKYLAGENVTLHDPRG